MNIRRRAHQSAAAELLEVMSIVATVALATDCAWVARDMIADGVTWGRILIATGLFSSCFFMIKATVSYHNRSVREKIAIELKAALKNARACHKRKCKKSVKNTNK